MELDPGHEKAVKNYVENDDTFEDKSDLNISDEALVKKSNAISSSNNDFATKYAHIEDFFKFESSKVRENGIFDMEFSCVKCLPVVKVLKTTTQAPMSNLRAHLRKIHADLMSQFDEQTRTSDGRRLKNPFKSKSEKNLEHTR